MTEVFRFANVRPVIKAAERSVQLKFARHSFAEYSQTLKDLAKEKDFEKATKLALVYAETKEFNPPPDETLVAIVKSATEQPTCAAAILSIEEAINTPLETYIASEKFISLKQNSWNTLYTCILIDNENKYLLDGAMLMIKIAHFLLVVGALPAASVPPSWADVLEIVPLLSEEIAWKPDTIPDYKGEQLPTETLNSLTDLNRRADSLLAAIAEIKRVDEKFLAKAPLVTITETDKIDGAAANEAGQAKGSLGTEDLWLKTAVAEAEVSHETFAILKKSKISPETVAHAQELFLDSARLDFVGFVNAQDKRQGYLLRGQPTYADLVRKLPGTVVPSPFDFVHTLPSPDFRGIKPTGIGDLFRVEQRLLRYELGEVAHVENVLRSESRDRVHVRVEEIEETKIEAGTISTENERDLQTTERFELSREVQKSVEEKTKTDAGVSVSASYGPVNVTAHADIAVESTAAIATKESSSYARQTTERAVNKIVSTVHTERVRRQLYRTEEKNTHTFDNKGGKDNVTGVYRWVDKIYQASLVNYGKRLMLEFTVPEPSAYYVHALAAFTKTALDTPKPEIPTINGKILLPSDLTKGNYEGYIARYRVQGADAYPAPVLQVNVGMVGVAAKGKNEEFSASDDSGTIPDGYRVRYATGYWAVTYYGNKYHLASSIAGSNFDSYWGYGDTAKVKLLTSGWLSTYNVNMKLVCEPTETLIEKWKIATFEKIMDGYSTLLGDYRRATQALEESAGPILVPRDASSKNIERAELKKASLQVLTNHYAVLKVGDQWRFNEVFDATKPTNGGPSIDVAEALTEAKIIRFFEQAFEWENMVYTYYPYFWGRKEKWGEALAKDHEDESFKAFLTAGSARVVVPVTPTFVNAMLFYLKTNVIWNGGDVPAIDDPLYVSIIDELKQGFDEVGEELPACSIESGYPCLADQWTIKVPTSLVYLQSDATLPDFEVGVEVVDWEKKLDDAAAKLGYKVNWRHSIVDLLKVLQRPSGLTYRRKLAKGIGAPDAVVNTGDTVVLNVWLHKALRKLLGQGEPLPDV